MENGKIKENRTAVNIISGVGISLGITLILLIIFSIILTYTNINENVINPVIVMIAAISILIGSSFRKYKNTKKWINKWWNYRSVHILL